MVIISAKLFIIWGIVLVFCILESRAFPVNNMTKTSHEKRKRESDISFPDELYDENDTDGMSATYDDYYNIVRPNCENDATFCEEVENYPVNLIESVLALEPEKYEQFFGADSISPTPQVLLAPRFGYPQQEHPVIVELLCNSRESLIFPKTGLTNENKWMYIVNHKRYVQGVRVETCLHTTECSAIGHFPFGFQSRCKQKFIYRQLLAINVDGTTSRNQFKVPCCCECVLYRRY